MTRSRELELAEQELDRLLLESDPEDPPSQLILLAYEVELAARKREERAWHYRQQRIASGLEGRVRPWQIPLVYAWRPLEHHGHNQHTGKCYCKHGHELTAENTYRRADGKGRDCRICRKARAAKVNIRRRKHAIA